MKGDTRSLDYSSHDIIKGPGHEFWQHVVAKI